MASGDSIIIFSEGTFQEQIQELVNYLARGLSQDDRITYIKPYQDVLITPAGGRPIAEDEERRQKTVEMVVAGVKGLGEGNEREQEGFFNLLVAHVFALWPATAPEILVQVDALVTQIAGATTQTPLVKYRIISNLFNAAPRNSAVRLHAYKALLNVAADNGEISLLQVPKSDVEGWLDEWDVSVEQKAELLEQIAEALEKSGQPYAYTFLVRRLTIIPAASSSAEQAALATISKALSLPFVYSFDAIMEAPAVASVKSHPLFSLLQVFWRGGVTEWAEWESAYSSTLVEFGLDKIALEQKLRLLALSSLSSQYLTPTSPAGTSDIPYTLISKALSIPEDLVEPTVIATIRANLVAGKLSQTTKSFRVYRAAVRGFEQPEWERLEERANAWRDGLLGVLSVLKSKRAAAAPEKGEGKVIVENVGATLQSEGVTVEAAA
ncbi:PCI-domain-containing protein [Calocera viscosa TUFC12733]|uniref:Eukaryotic translation initiation factor 3 subunit M n=1 Tax=Calocera viscosa (strain TUFC12733) TaxID=1330018 RepID=A0A167QTS5_CALVF|nr:PCI-domain-containing protein [Calocera viscosa TUFC12733]